MQKSLAEGENKREIKGQILIRVVLRQVSLVLLRVGKNNLLRK